MATLPGRRLYLRCGYVPTGEVRHPVGDGIEIEFVPMAKDLA